MKYTTTDDKPDYVGQLAFNDRLEITHMAIPYMPYGEDSLIWGIVKSEHAKQLREQIDSMANLFSTHDPDIRPYQVWLEGYQANGDSAGATFRGEIKAEDFADACLQWAASQIGLQHFNSGSLTYWGCKFFDNEADAKKSFG